MNISQYRYKGHFLSAKQVNKVEKHLTDEGIDIASVPESELAEEICDFLDSENEKKLLNLFLSKNGIKRTRAERILGKPLSLDALKKKLENEKNLCSLDDIINMHILAGIEYQKDFRYKTVKRLMKRGFIVKTANDVLTPELEGQYFFFKDDYYRVNNLISKWHWNNISATEVNFKKLYMLIEDKNELIWETVSRYNAKWRTPVLAIIIQNGLTKLDAWNDAHLQNVVRSLKRKPTIRNYFVDLVDVLCRGNAIPLDTRYFNIEHEVGDAVDPYPDDLYCEIMGPLIYPTPDYLNRLVQMALNDVEFAKAWKETAMHAVCAWRETNIIRVNLKNILVTDQDIVNLRDGTYQSKQIAAVAREVVRQNNNNINKAIKNGVETRICIPHSAEETFGIIFAINAYYQQQPGYLYTGATEESKKKLLGRVYNCLPVDEDDDTDDYSEKRYLNMRRLNKTYLNSLYRLEKENMPVAHAMLPYLLAAYIRGHRMDNVEIPESTAHYISDEMGVQSFICALFEEGAFGAEFFLLCKILIDDFDSFSAKIQNLTIGKMKLKIRPLEIEQILKSYKIEVRNTRKLIASIYEGSIGKGRIDLIREKLMNSIRKGHYETKENNVICIYSAIHEVCPKTDGRNCLNDDPMYGGCVWGIRTIHYLNELVTSMNRLQEEIKRTSNDDTKKLYRRLQNQVYAPMTFGYIEELSRWGYNTTLLLSDTARRLYGSC